MYKILKSTPNGIDELELEQLEKGCWIDIVSPSPEELHEIAAATKIQLDFLTAALDEEEKSRIETEDDQILILVDIDELEQHLRKSMENSELFNLLDLQKSLTYFTTSLRSNYIVTEKLLRLRSTNQSGHLIKLYEEDEDLLEDVIIEYKQAIEMVEMYSHILNSMMEVFASIISNNLNLVMKFLASVTIILAIPTTIGGLWGMNVPVPLEGNEFGFVTITSIALLISVGTGYWLWKRRMF